MTKVLLVGVGLIGGSFSLALKGKNKFEFGGVSRRSSTLDTAEKLGIISNKFDSIEDGVSWADWIILSIPVDIIKTILPDLLDQIKDDQLVIDFGSTKGAICDAVKDHPKRTNYLAAHPIAGTEYSGPDAAFPGLFKEKCLIICEREKTKVALRNAFELVAQEVGFYLVMMGAQEHDRHLAYISHLSHVTSFALSNTVLSKEKDGEVILELAGSGFESTVRLAKSSAEMWTPIFMENREMLLESIENYLKQIIDLKSYLQQGDQSKIHNFLKEGREIRRILK